MTRLPHLLMVLGCSLLLTAGCQTMTGETLGQNFDDAAITFSVKSQLATNDRLRTLTKIGVKTVRQTVYLSGELPSPQERNRAEEIARQVNGVQRVVNNINVQP